jgi:hypothetical protein
MIVLLNSVGSVLCDVQKKIFPRYADGTFDINDDVNGVLLHEADREWYESLDDDDKKVVNFYLFFYYNLPHLYTTQ